MKCLLYILMVLTFGFCTIAFAADESLDGSAYIKNSKAPHQMRIVNSGVASLYARLDMIKNAKTTIELETFIFTPDTAGRLILKELVAAAKRGVKVRMLIDKNSFNFKLDENYAEELRKYKIDIRYYNAASNLNFGNVQYRNHRKLMVIDDKEVITGGRNIADEYYDLSDRLNFLDRDTTVKGPIVKDMRESFDKYWNSSMVQTPQQLREIKIPGPSLNPGAKEQYFARMQKQKIDARAVAAEEVSKTLGPNEEDDKKLQYVMSYGKKVFYQSNEHKCPNVTFATDREGGSVGENLADNYEKDYRYLSATVVKFIGDKTTKELTIDSPYFLKNKINLYVGSHAEKANVKVNIFTNSLASTDAVHVASVFNDTIEDFTPNPNFQAYTFKGKFMDETELYNKEIKNATWGTHSKSVVFNDDTFMIGTINMDNRSINFNTELGVFCSGSKELAAEVESNIKLRMQGAYRLNAEGNPNDCSSILKDVTTSKRALYYILKIPSKLMESLL